MNTELIKEIAKEVVNETIITNWLYYLILLCIGFIGAYFVAYIKGYAQEKAKNNALKSDLDDIKTQLQETTKVTEEIKSNIEHSIWRKKEIELVKREKLEEYFEHIYSGKAALHQEMLEAFFSKDVSYDRHALNKADILQKLYFPELAEEHALFRDAQSKYLMWIGEGQKEVARKMEQGIERKVATPSKEHMQKQSEILEAINNSASLLTQAGKKYAESLNA